MPLATIGLLYPVCLFCIDSWAYSDRHGGVVGFNIETLQLGIIVTAVLIVLAREESVWLYPVHTSSPARDEYFLPVVGGAAGRAYD